MLVDVVFPRVRDPILALLTGFTAASGPTEPVRLNKGVYEIGHFSFDHELGGIRNFEQKYPELREIGAYGVCDHYMQVVNRCPDLQEHHYKSYVMSVTPIRKSEQPPDGGWRWHKWGGYIGVQEPTTEYIHDEPKIELVYCYHVYAVTPEMQA